MRVSPRVVSVLRWAVLLKLLVGAAVLALWMCSACALFPTAVDPCPLPPEQHPDAWTATPTAGGAFVTYLCTGAGLTVR